MFIAPGNGGTVHSAYNNFASSTPGGNCSAKRFVDAGYNADDDGTCGLTGTGSMSDLVALGSSLLPLGNYGGLTQTILPTSDSPLVASIPFSPPTMANGSEICPRSDGQAECQIPAIVLWAQSRASSGLRRASIPGATRGARYGPAQLTLRTAR